MVSEGVSKSQRVVHMSWGCKHACTRGLISICTQDVHLEDVVELLLLLNPTEDHGHTHTRYMSCYAELVEDGK